MTSKWTQSNLMPCPNHSSHEQFQTTFLTIPSLPLEGLSRCGCSVIIQNCTISNQWEHLKYRKKNHKPGKRYILKYPEDFVQINKNPNIQSVKWIKRANREKIQISGIHIKRHSLTDNSTNANKNNNGMCTFSSNWQRWNWLSKSMLRSVKKAALQAGSVLVKRLNPFRRAVWQPGSKPGKPQALWPAIPLLEL